MTGLNHAAVGALAAAAINKPAIALPAALLSHFAADMVPHWDYKVPGGVKGRLKIMAVDLFLSLALLVILALSVDATPWVVALGGLLGMAPDIMWTHFFLTGKPAPIDNKIMAAVKKFHLWIQWSETSRGFFVELAWFPLMLWLIYQVHH